MNAKTNTKAVAVKEEHAVSNEFAGMFDKSLTGAGETMDADDIRLAKLTLIQGMTKAAFNTEGVKVGNYINSIEKQDMGDTLDMFVMDDQKLWQFDYEVKEGKKIKKEYLTITDHGACPNIRKDFNAAAIPAEVKEAMERKGVKIEQLLPPDMIYRFSVLLVDEVLAGTAFPYLIDFKRSSAPAGNKLKNIFFKMKSVAGVPSYAKVLTLGSDFVQAEHDYYIKTTTSGRNITKEELIAVESWVKELAKNSSKYTADESDADESNFNNDIETEAIPAATNGKQRF